MCAKRFGEATGEDRTTVGDDVDTVLLCNLGALTYCAELRITNTSLKTSRAGSSGTNSNFDYINQSIVSKLVDPVGSHDITCHQNHVRMRLSESRADLDELVQIAICDIYADHLDFLVQNFVYFVYGLLEFGDVI